MPAASVTYTFAANTLIKASEANQNFTDLVNWLDTNAIQVDASNSFTGVPSGPATDPSSANQLTRKAYVDAKVPTVGNVTQPSGTHNYGDTFLYDGLFTPTESVKLRMHVTLDISSVQTQTMLLHYFVRDQSTLTDTSMLTLLIPDGTNTISGTSEWVTIAAASYKFRGVVDAVSVPSGNVVLNSARPKATSLTYEYVRA